VRTRTQQLADELKQVIRMAGRDPEALEGRLPSLATFSRVTAAGVTGDAAQVHLILHRLIPEYLDRLPAGRDCRAIRELMTWEDEDGEVRSLTTRYHKAAAHLVNAAHDFGRRQEPRLLLECARRFIALDHEDRASDGRIQTAPAPRSEDTSHHVTLPSIPADDPSTGIAGVHRNLDYHVFAERMADAASITILNTWIPELSILADGLAEALARGTDVRILMLYPHSRIAKLRTEALHGTKQAPFRENQVRPGVKHCLDVLSAIASMLDDEHRSFLRVRLYNSLPSIAVYGVDDRAFVSLFLHGQLAIKMPQIEVRGEDSLLGRAVFGEVETLWQIGQQFEDVTSWPEELDRMGERFGIAPADPGDARNS
jgi:hypothetical protein